MGARNILRLFNGALEGEDQSVEQLTSTTTPVTLNSVRGTIETYYSTAAADAAATFVFNNSKIKAGSVVLATVGNYLQVKDISAATEGTTTAYEVAAHGLAVGDVVTVIGVTGDADANGRFTVTAVTTDTFTVAADTDSSTLNVSAGKAVFPAGKRGTTQGAGTSVVSVTNTKSGQCDITIENEHASAALNGTVPVSFIVLD